MNSHNNARLGFSGRVCLVSRLLDKGWDPRVAAGPLAVSVQTVRKWLRRYRAEGRAGLRDRSSHPHCSPRQLSAALERRIAQLRSRRWSGPQIADALQLTLFRLGDVLRCLGLARLPSPRLGR